jgi:hypothetical protein
MNSINGNRQAYLQQLKRDSAGKIFVAIDLHDHQPIYRPGTNPADTPEIQQNILGSGDADNRREVYKDAEAYAIESMQGRPEFPHFGIQVSYSGSLIENLNATAQRGLWPGAGWSQHYRNLRGGAPGNSPGFTGLGNPRLDFVNIGYHHPLMGLIASGHADGSVQPDKDVELQFKMHQQAVSNTFGGPVSKGCFPAEMAFSERMIPALRRSGIDWVMVDNIHVDRANDDYHNPGDGLAAPNGADAKNPGPHAYQNMPNDLAKTHTVSPEALRPHYAVYTDPVTGKQSRIVVVPEERSLSSFIQKDRDASKMQLILDRFSQYNTDPEHPLLVLYATDGDNNGSNSGEFHRNVPVDLATRYPDKVVLTTVQDYLDMFPPAEDDVVHIEDGAWWGANLGDPQYSKWIDNPNATYYSPKNNSWATLTAAKNAVLTADAMEPAGNTPASIANIAANQGSDTEQAWHGLLVGQSSDYEYWGVTDALSYSAITASNMATAAAGRVLARHAKSDDKVGPSVFLPMRDPHDPTGGFNVATYAYDVSGVASVKLKYRTGADAGETYAGNAWSEVDMAASPYPEPAQKPPVWVEPQARADVYRGHIAASAGSTVHYFVEATDTLGNVTRSPIQHAAVQ